MKKLAVLVFVILISVTSFATEKTETSNKEVKKEIRNEIVKLLKNNNFDASNTITDIEAVVEFLINSKGEIVVINVSTNNPDVAEFVKYKLNYKKITTKKIVGVYEVPLRIKK